MLTGSIYKHRKYNGCTSFRVYTGAVSTLNESVPDFNEIGMLEYCVDIDDEEYQGWLNDNRYVDGEETRMKYFRTEVYFEIELLDSEYYHHMQYESMTYDDICDEFTPDIAETILRDCFIKGKGSLEIIDYIADEIDINNPDELNAEAMKLLKNGSYFKDCRGFILTNGVCVYTETEHNMIQCIKGIDSKFQFIELGNIRVMPNNIDVGAMPTYEQECVLMKICKCYARDTLYLDCHKDGYIVFSKEYEYPTFDMLMRDISKVYED